VCVECQVVELPALRLTFVHSVAETSRLEQIRLLLPARDDGVSVAKAHILGTEVDLAESQGVPVAQGGETAAEGSLAGTGESAGIARLLSQALNQTDSLLHGENSVVPQTKGFFLRRNLLLTVVVRPTAHVHLPLSAEIVIAGGYVAGTAPLLRL